MRKKIAFKERHFGRERGAIVVERRKNHQILWNHVGDEKSE